jgi:hypothetical protein
MVLHGVKRDDFKLTTALLIAEVKKEWSFIACTGRRVSSAWNCRASWRAREDVYEVLGIVELHSVHRKTCMKCLEL